MRFDIDGISYEITRHTAIAQCDNGDESQRQDALLVVSDNGTETNEYVVFGWDMPEKPEDLDDMAEDINAWAALQPEHKLI